MPSPVSSIPNLGPATEAAFAKAGLNNAEQIRALGADTAYLRWLGAGLPAHFIGFYALVMGLQGRPWTDCRGDEKKALRVRFDALKLEAAKSGPVATWSKTKGRSEIEAALDALGVVEKPR
ncbi:MAG: TfoX/Sxy family DNA transformation protein [Paracoccaceae bacterium]|nr:TfoX/Sxy family DNA transformation protein [Paracoccaceae bacterium]